MLSCDFPPQKKSKKSSETLTFKRPEGMHREVYALLYSDKKQVLESQVPQLWSLTHLQSQTFRFLCQFSPASPSQLVLLLAL